MRIKFLSRHRGCGSRRDFGNSLSPFTRRTTQKGKSFFSPLTPGRYYFCGKKRPPKTKWNYKMMILFDSCLIPSICACHVSSVSKNRVSQSKGGNFLNFLNFLNFNNVLLNDMCVRRIRVDQPCDKISTWTGGYFLLPSVNPILVQQFYLAKLFFIILNLFF